MEKSLSLNQTSPGGGMELNSRLLVPTVVVLTFVALLNSIQDYFVFFTGVHSVVNFARFLVSDLFYFWYFIIPALAVRWLSGRVAFRKESLVAWCATHLATLVALTVIHQIASLEIDKFILGSRQTQTIFTVLFNNPAVWGDFVVYVLFLLGFYMMEFRRKDREKEIEYSLLETELVKSRLQELRSKVHPQFLLDTLDMARALIRKRRGKEANAVLSWLSDFLRSTVYGSYGDETPLEEELTFLERYSSIEKMRFGGRLAVKLDVDEDALKALVPSFIIQPIVEELIRSNLDNSHSRCEIAIMSNREDGSLALSVSASLQTGNGLSEVEHDEKSVFTITSERLAQMYGSDYLFSFDTTSREKKAVRIKIPFKERDQAVELPGRNIP